MMIPMRGRRLIVAGLLVTALTAGYVWLVDPPPIDLRERAGVCPLHERPLVEGIVPVVYGLPPRWTKQDVESHEATCPRARPYINGGCVVGSATTARVRYCPECRKAFPAWQAAHPNAR
jgi:hypothetical protein